MLNTIGELSGIIWKVLDDKGELTLAKLKKAIDADEFSLYSALGWLAREDKINIDKSGRSVKISLK